MSVCAMPACVMPVCVMPIIMRFASLNYRISLKLLLHDLLSALKRPLSLSCRVHLLLIIINVSSGSCLQYICFS